MKIKTAFLKNYKSFDNNGILITFNDITGLIGENSAGKSNIMAALDLFFNYSKTKISRNIFFHDDVSNGIETRLTFSTLSQQEKELFNVYLDDNGDLTVTQYINAEVENEEELKVSEYKEGHKYVADIEWACYCKHTSKDINKWWSGDLVINGLDFKSLFDSADIPDSNIYNEKIEILWRDYNSLIPKKIEMVKDKPFNNLINNYLPSFLYIPALTKTSDEVKVSKTNPFGKIINWLSEDINKSITKEYQEKLKKLIEKAKRSCDTKVEINRKRVSKLEYINQLLNYNMEIGLGCTLQVRFGEPQLSELTFSDPQIYADDGYSSAISEKGHGMQRMTIVSLLRTYTDINKLSKRESKNTIIAFEEPELYLHPSKKRATYKMLRELSKGEDQVIYSTHDSYFVDVEFFDEIRLIRKTMPPKPKTIIYQLPVERLISDCKARYGIDVQADSIRQRFANVYDEAKNEGFFAKKVILVEGDTEKYALPIYFDHFKYDIDKNDVAIIVAGSVDNITYLYVIFNELGIPCYVIFDGDCPKIEMSTLNADQRKEANSKSRRNKEIFNFLNQEVNIEGSYFFPETTIGNNFAVWKHDFESCFHKSIDIYESLKSEAKAFFGNDSKPLTAKFIAKNLVQKHSKKISTDISKLIKEIEKLGWEGTCLKE